MKIKKALILLLVMVLILLTLSGCITKKNCDLKLSNIETTFHELLEQKQVDIDDCSISDPPMVFDIAWQAENGEVNFMLCGIAVDSHEYKEQTYTIEYDESTCIIDRGEALERLNDTASLHALLDFVVYTDFSELYQNDIENSIYCEIRTDGVYEDFSTIADSGIRNDYRLYIYEDHMFYEFDQYEGDLSRCIGIFFSTYSSETGDLVGNTNVLILYK